MTPNNTAERIAAFGKSIFDRGLTAGTAGNIRRRLADDPNQQFARRSLSYAHVAPRPQWKTCRGQGANQGDLSSPSDVRYAPDCTAVVHLHSTQSVAVSCLTDVDSENVLPPIAAYYAMRIGTLPLIPYFKPGDLKLADAVWTLADSHHAVLLANHGPVVVGTSLEAAVAAIEELEETAKLFLLLHGYRMRYLTPERLEELGISKLR
jgi:ribulose-5-phosphate 4-epimerase/fuculose-1-phosphate aldolase